MVQKKRIVDHALYRYVERTDTDVSPKEIVESIKQNNFTYFKRLTPTRSMAYVNVIKTHFDKEIFKLILNRKSKTIITILPWKSLFHVCYVIEMEKYSKKFTVHLYPDCYLETNKPQALTKIHEHIVDPMSCTIQLNYNHPLFEIIFNAAWETFEGFNDAHKTLCEEREKGNETFKIKDEYENRATHIHYRSHN
jgi:hypothetical protein